MCSYCKRRLNKRPKCRFKPGDRVYFKDTETEYTDTKNGRFYSSTYRLDKGPHVIDEITGDGEISLYCGAWFHESDFLSEEEMMK